MSGYWAIRLLRGLVGVGGELRTDHPLGLITVLRDHQFAPVEKNDAARVATMAAATGYGLDVRRVEGGNDWGDAWIDVANPTVNRHRYLVLVLTEWTAGFVRHRSPYAAVVSVVSSDGTNSFDPDPVLISNPRLMSAASDGF